MVTRPLFYDSSTARGMTNVLLNVHHNLIVHDDDDDDDTLRDRFLARAIWRRNSSTVHRQNYYLIFSTTPPQCHLKLIPSTQHKSQIDVATIIPPLSPLCFILCRRITTRTWAQLPQRPRERKSSLICKLFPHHHNPKLARLLPPSTRYLISDPPRHPRVINISNTCHNCN